MARTKDYYALEDMLDLGGDVLKTSVSALAFVGLDYLCHKHLGSSSYEVLKFAQDASDPSWAHVYLVGQAFCLFSTVAYSLQTVDGIIKIPYRAVSGKYKETKNRIKNVKEKENKK